MTIPGDAGAELARLSALRYAARTGLSVTSDAVRRYEQAQLEQGRYYASAELLFRGSLGLRSYALAAAVGLTRRLFGIGRRQAEDSEAAMTSAAREAVPSGIDREVVEPLLLHACHWFLPGFGPADEARVKLQLRRACLR